MNKLVLNKNKTKLVAFPKGITLDPTILLNSFQVEVVDDFRFLGFFMSNSLKWNNHIEHVTKKLKSCLYIICRYNSFLPREKLLLIFNAIGLPHIQYVAPLLHGATKSSLEPLKKTIQ